MEALTPEENFMNYLQAIIVAIVQGITEFIPVSSTGHMIITGKLLGIEIDDFVRLFIVCIQFGSILAVVVLYFKRFFQTMSFYYKLFVAFLPAAIIGVLFHDYIDALLDSALVVAIALIIGGVVFIFIDKLFDNSRGSDPNNTNSSGSDPITYPKALKIGLFQVLAMIPGVSRSAATIIGGLTQKLSRKTATEFSFFLAVPTMFGATAYKLLKMHDQINIENLKLLLFGNLVAFIVSIIAIKGLIAYLQKHGFKLFGYYRICVGILIIVLVIFKVI